MITIPDKLKSILIDSSNNTDIEIGFILLGSNDGDNYIIDRIVSINNASKSDHKFTPENEDIIKIQEYCVENGYNVLGFFHSHLYNTASPSRQDIELMKQSSQLWLIYSKLNNNMFAFTYKDKLESIEIVTIYT